MIFLPSPGFRTASNSFQNVQHSSLRYASFS
nr:MAG TPA: hypothetical protein [Caudoviricetes sp.]